MFSFRFYDMFFVYNVRYLNQLLLLSRKKQPTSTSKGADAFRRSSVLTETPESGFIFILNRVTLRHISLLILRTVIPSPLHPYQHTHTHTHTHTQDETCSSKLSFKMYPYQNKFWPLKGFKSKTVQLQIFHNFVHLYPCHFSLF